MTSLITKITDPKFTPPEGAHNTKAFLEQLKKCGCVNPLRMHAVFCSGIHGAPWSGTAVRVFKNQLHSSFVCMIEFMASTYSLDVVDANASK